MEQCAPDGNHRKTHAFRAALLSAMATAFILLAAYPAGAAFSPLFNGENLDGWVNVNCAPETWAVRDGMIVCTGIPNGVLRTVDMYENYVLELEWRHLKEGGNAGLFVHADALPAPGMPFPRCVECQILDGNQGDMFAIGGAMLVPDTPHPKGWTRSLPSEDRMNPTGEWNHYRVESRYGMLTLAVNGKVVTRAYNINPRRGYICLESEGSEIHFRNIRIQVMPSDDPPRSARAEFDRGFTSLYNGVDLRGWKRVPGNEGHWTAQNWVLDYDGKSGAVDDDRHLWTERSYRDFELIIDWRQSAEPVEESVPVILPDGSVAKDGDGNDLTAAVMDAGDSGLYLRGVAKSQINIWNWPVGSGEIWGYRTDEAMAPDVRRGATPVMNADNPPGRWNRFVITVESDRVTVVLNGSTVIDDARLPGMPREGPIALQHHGDPIQFANIYIREIQ